MELVHHPMPTCDGGAACGPDCHFRKLLESDPRYAGYLAPGRTQRTASCRHLGGDTGAMIECPSCAGSVRVKMFECAIHRSCTLAKPVPGVACCQGCPDFAPSAMDADAIYVEATGHSNGIGDHAILALLLQDLKRRNPGRRIVLLTGRDDCAAWIRHWWPDTMVAEAPPGAQVLRPLNERPLGKQGLPRWEHAARRANASLAIPPLAAPLPHDDGTWRLQGHVVLAPEANSADRPWPRAAWIDLERRLLDRGFPCVVIGTNASSLIRFRSTPFIGQEPGRVLAVLQRASCVVGNDSGMVHLAGLLGTPAVALCGLVGGRRVFGAYRTVRWIDGPLPCNGCEWSDPERQLYGCVRCASLDMIQPAQVLDLVEELTCRWVWDETLLPAGPRAALQRAARETAGLDGELAELGVRRGGSAAIMAAAAPTKPIHLFDTFTGMPVSDPEGDTVAGQHAASLDVVWRLFNEAWLNRASAERVKIHQGIFPATAAGLEQLRFACVHLDADQYAPTSAAIDYFWPRMVAGGRIVFDDWKRGTCPGIERAVREHFKPEQIDETAEYQCTVTKP